MMIYSTNCFSVNNTPVNQQITDSVSQTNVKVLGSAPAISMANNYTNLNQNAGSSSLYQMSDYQNSAPSTSSSIMSLYNEDSGNVSHWVQIKAELNVSRYFVRINICQQNRQINNNQTISVNCMSNLPVTMPQFIYQKSVSLDLNPSQCQITLMPNSQPKYIKTWLINCAQ